MLAENKWGTCVVLSLENVLRWKEKYFAIFCVQYMTRRSIFGSEDPDLGINSLKLKLIF